MFQNKDHRKEYKQFIRTLLFLAVPIIANEFLNSLVNVMDSLMIGRLGPNEINAVGFGNELFFLYVVFIFGVASGCSIFMGQYWGKGDVKRIHNVMGLCFTAALLISLAFAVIAFFFPAVFLSFYSVEPVVIRMGAQYLRIMAVSYLMTGLTVSFNAALRSVGQTKFPMMTTLIALVVNFVLNYLFIFVFGWGVQGAALATVIARGFELAAQFALIFSLRLPVAAKAKDYFAAFRLADAAFIRTIFRGIVPVFLNESIWALGMTLYNVAYRSAGNDAQAAVRIAASVQNLFMVIALGISSGCGILIANTLGGGEIETAKRAARRCLLLSMLVSVVMGGCLVGFSPLILSNYRVSELIRADAFKIMCIIAFMMLFKAFNFTAIVGILRNGGDTKFCLLLDTASVWLIGVPAAFIGIALGLPIYVVVAAVNCEEIFKFGFSFWRVAKNKWARSIV